MTTPTTVLAPKINTNDDKVQIVRWHVKAGDQIDAGQEIVDLETSKAVVTINAELSGFVRPLVEVKTVLKVGAPLYLVASTEDGLSQAPVASSAAPSAVPAAKTSTAPSYAPPAAAAVMPGRAGHFTQTRFSKAALALLTERGWKREDFNAVGLVTVNHLTAPVVAVTEAPAVTAQASPVPSLPPGPETAHVDDVSLGKQAEIQSLTIGESGNVNSMLSIMFSAEAIRKRLVEEKAFNGNLQPIILFELCRLLKKWPQYTAYFQDNRIHYYDQIHLGLAVDVGKGLKVVKIDNADSLMPINFYVKSMEIGLKYLRNQLKLEDLMGSTITVSDLSGSNILHFHPLINGHQSVIIGIGGDTSLPGQPMTINMTFDHRVSSGREAAAFLNELKARILSYAQGPDASVIVTKLDQGAAS